MTNKVNSISTWLLAGSALAFLALYFILSANTRLASDDVVFFSIKMDMNALDYLKSFYFSWSGRWASGLYFYSITSLTNRFENVHFYLFLYYCLTFCLLFYSVNKIIRFFIFRYFRMLPDKIASYTYSILFISCFYYITLQTGEVWWWLCSSVDTLQGIVSLLFGIALLSVDKKNFIHYILICFSFAYVGGGTEIYALIVGILFILLFCYFYKNRKSTSELKEKIFKSGMALAFISLLIASLISFSAPGNRNRRDAESENRFSENTVSANFNLTDNGKDIFLQKKYILGLALASAWMILGMRIRKESKTREQNFPMKRLLMWASIPFLVSIVITWGFQALLLKGFLIPLRGWTFSSFSLSFFLCLFFFCLGYSISLKSVFSEYAIKIMLPLTLFIGLSFNAIKQYQYASDYAQEYDHLMSILVEAENDSTINICYAKALPPSGMLIPLDIRDDYMKDPLKKIFGIKAEIRVVD